MEFGFRVSPVNFSEFSGGFLNPVFPEHTLPCLYCFKNGISRVKLTYRKQFY